MTYERLRQFISNLELAPHGVLTEYWLIPDEFEELREVIMDFRIITKVNDGTTLDALTSDFPFMGVHIFKIEKWAFIMSSLDLVGRAEFMRKPDAEKYQITAEAIAKKYKAEFEKPLTVENERTYPFPIKIRWI